MNISCRYLCSLIAILSLLYLSTTAQSSKDNNSNPSPTASAYFEKVYVKYDEGKVLISWPKAEKMDDLIVYYSIERSSNGIHFKTIKLSMEKDPTSFTDDDPLQGLSYYRVRKIISGGGQMNFSLSREFAIKNSSNPALANTK
jgi:hypothetical protein